MEAYEGQRRVLGTVLLLERRGKRTPAGRPSKPAPCVDRLHVLRAGRALTVVTVLTNCAQALLLVCVHMVVHTAMCA